MIQQVTENAETLVSAIVFASIFFAGSRWRIELEVHKGYRRVVSFSAGIAIAYVFMNFLPELSGASELFLEHTRDLPYPFPQHWVYGASLLGFVLFYGIEYISIPKLSSVDGQKAQESLTEKARFFVTIVAYSLYTGLICYLLVRSLEGGYANEALYTVAMALHFLSLRYSLWNEYEDMFGRWGKNILGVSCLVGWLVAVFLPQPATVIITLLGFISGGVIMNTMIAELPRENQGRFLYFFLGAALYAGLLN
jgi:zinc transporter ZupT